MIAASALAPLGCQIAPHGERAALRAIAVEPDPGDARTLASVLAQADALGVAETPVAHAVPDRR